MENIALVICNEAENAAEFPFTPIAVVPHRSIWIRKVIYKLQFILKYLPFSVSSKKREGYMKALIEHKITTVHIHFGIMAVEFMEICEKLELPLLVTFHGFDITAAVHRDPSYKKALMQLFEKMHTGIAISNEMKKRLIALGCAPEKIAVSYLGVPLQEFIPTDRTLRIGTVKFLHAGRLSATKGVPDLIRSFSAAFGENDPVELIIVGNGEEIDDVHRAISESLIKAKIKFLGKVSNQELMNWRKECDVFVLNCRTPKSGDKEGLPIALLEASSTALPIISTRHAGIEEGVLHEQTGLLVDEYDNKALSQAMQRMMNQQTRLLYGKQAREWMEAQFDVVKCNELLDDIYTQSLKI
jgi:glycosyltransferase involved in cell wall biosynthesis